MITGEFLDHYSMNSDAYAIRKEVFIDELSCDDIFLNDNVDTMAHHILVKDGDLPIGTGRIILDDLDTYIGRIAVLKSHRGQSIGDLIVRMLIDRAFRLGLEPIKVFARLDTLDFYKSIGFEVISESYVKEAVEIIEMTIMEKNMKRKCH
ncbi:MAG: GNAT family N-acetyltransferase [Vallitaleaceae bacterium]|jgi:predicted GNAT family N-acyltransferase|nr:GNAT family N-acetyltransferase [Vallitaleaceae bacterium]